MCALDKATKLMLASCLSRASGVYSLSVALHASLLLLCFSVGFTSNTADLAQRSRKIRLRTLNLQGLLDVPLVSGILLIRKKPRLWRCSSGRLVVVVIASHKPPKSQMAISVHLPKDLYFLIFCITRQCYSQVPYYSINLSRIINTKFINI